MVVVPVVIVQSLGWDAGIYKAPQVFLIQWDLGSLH